MTLLDPIMLEPEDNGAVSAYVPEGACGHSTWRLKRGNFDLEPGAGAAVDWAPRTCEFQFSFDSRISFITVLRRSSNST